MFLAIIIHLLEKPDLKKLKKFKTKALSKGDDDSKKCYPFWLPKIDDAKRCPSMCFNIF